ncbi:MAG: DUF3185 domain-containing protein [Verrucomicrobia bacterium]|nr:DUF3185 domain-containing protein [Verrucomicrobiota bacterium]
MKPPSIIGILLIVLGIAAFAYQSFTYTTTEKAIDLGPIQVTTEKEHTLPLSPVVGAAALIGGVLLLMQGRSKS